MAVKKQKKKIAKIKAHNKSEKAKQKASRNAGPVCRPGDESGTLKIDSCRKIYEPKLKKVPSVTEPHAAQSTPTGATDSPPATGRSRRAAPPERESSDDTAQEDEEAEEPEITPEQAVHQVVKASLHYHAPQIGVAPNHDMNHLRAKNTGEKLDSVVGYPIWFWAKGGTRHSRHITKKVDDLKVKLSVKPERLVVDPGTGNTVTCTGTGTAWSPAAAGQHKPMKSPTCGYTYKKAGDYTVTMTTYWKIDYAVSDGSDTLTGSQEYHGSHDRTLTIGEYQVVVTG